ncbi:MAG: hypothetical protein ACTFAL_11920 [Candidatus Electronema sp. V4]|uniref:hypothetical protein n=1 Tax=Candidatus Electronema sp. V4 TaxID=3454756 RepID=UPI0040557E21
MAGSKNIEAKREARKQAREEVRLRERSEAKRVAERLVRDDEARRMAKCQEARREALELERALDEESARRRIRQEALRATRLWERTLEQRRRQAAEARQRETKPRPVGRSVRSTDGRRARDDRRNSADATRSVHDQAASKPARDKSAKSSRAAAVRADALRLRELRAKKRSPDAVSPREDRNRAAGLRHRSVVSSVMLLPRPEITPAAPAQDIIPVPARDPLCARIPSGRYSGALPWLQTVGNRLLTLDGDEVVLRGFDLTCMTDACFDPVAVRSLVSVLTARLFMLLDWGATLVRLPIPRSLALDDNTGSSSVVDRYLDAIDGLIAMCAERGAYSLLSIEPRDARGVRSSPSGNDESMVTLAQTLWLWQRLGERYAGEPAVLFDLFTPLASGMLSPEGADLTRDHRYDWVRLLVARLRDVHPRAVVTIAGIDAVRDWDGIPGRRTRRRTDSQSDLRRPTPSGRRWSSAGYSDFRSPRTGAGYRMADCRPTGPKPRYGGPDVGCRRHRMDRHFAAGGPWRRQSRRRISA